MEVFPGAVEIAAPQSGQSTGIMVERIFRIEVDGPVVLLYRTFSVPRDRVKVAGSDERASLVYLRLANLWILSLERREPGGRAAG
jgi:hypothetical protein